ncbi:hypothetical protein BIY28_17060 [Brenneria goodwinii]|nr:hypothetical protein BIY28_17060 [Brenneria goodwinii]
MKRRRPFSAGLFSGGTAASDRGRLVAANRLCEMTHAPFEVSPLIVHGIFHYPILYGYRPNLRQRVESTVIGSRRSP